MSLSDLPALETVHIWSNGLEQLELSMNADLSGIASSDFTVPTINVGDQLDEIIYELSDLTQPPRPISRPSPTYPPELIQLLEVHAFPGNIRELRAMVYDAVVRHTARTLSTDTFKKFIFPTTRSLHNFSSVSFDDLFSSHEVLPTLKIAADALVDEAMQRSGNNQKIAAAMLGISPPALNKRLKLREKQESKDSAN